MMLKIKACLSSTIAMAFVFALLPLLAFGEASSSASLPDRLLIPLPGVQGGRWLLLDKQHKPLREADLADLSDYTVHGNAILPAPAKAADGRWGYIDVHGQWAVRPKFDVARTFSVEGLARVKQGGRWGYLGADLKMRIDPQFDEADAFRNGLAAVKQKGLWGFIDAQGRQVIPPTFEVAWSFGRNGLARVRLAEKKFAFIDRSGKLAIPGPFERALGFGEQDVAPVQHKDQMGLIDKQGNWVLKPAYSMIETFNRDGLAPFRKTWSEIGYLNNQGKVVIPAREGVSEVLAANRIRLGADGAARFSFLDGTGKLAIPGPFDWVGSFDESGAPIPARRDGRWGLLNTKGGWQELGGREPMEDGENHDLAVDAKGDELSPWLLPGQGIEWLDQKGQVIYRLEQKSNGEGGRFYVQLRYGSEVVWQSALQKDRLVFRAFFEPDAADVMEQKEETIPALARQLLASKPRKFLPYSQIFGERNDPYDLSAVNPGDQEDASFGAIEVLASTYVSEKQWGRFHFLGDQRDELFDGLHKRLCKRLAKEFGAPITKLVPKVTLSYAPGKETCMWQIGQAYLALHHYFETGDGDFEHQLQLVALHALPAGKP